MADFGLTHNLHVTEKKWRKKLKKYPKMKKRILDDIGKYMMRETKRRFDQQVSPSGSPWKPLSKLTKNARKKGGGSAGSGHKALLDTGAGKQSINYMLVGTDGVQVGPDNIRTASYLAFQQRGFQSVITRKQAWWMVFNLYGFNKDSPYDSAFASAILVSPGEESTRGDWLAWHAASRLARTLEGSTLSVPARPFAGINQTNTKEFAAILKRHLKRDWGKK